MSIFSRLEKTGCALSFHTPGHKGKLNPLDGTELDGAFPLDCIEKAQEKAAAHYGAKQLRFLVNGSSIGVKSMIMAAGGDIIAPENRHPSADEGAELAGVNVYCVKTQEKFSLPMPMTAEDIEKEYLAHPSVKAALVVSPDYYGFVADLKSIRAMCDKLGIFMLVDSAHGAHFASLDEANANPVFPVSATRIADACNLSAHKTMRAYTQSAYLAINNGALTDKIDHALKLLGTTSPSYILMGQLERAIEYEQENAEKYRILQNVIDKNITGNRFVRVPNDDPMRVVVSFEKSGMKGSEVYEKLAARGIYAEKYDEHNVVFIVTLSDDKEDIVLLGDELRRI